MTSRFKVGDMVKFSPDYDSFYGDKTITYKIVHITRDGTVHIAVPRQFEGGEPGRWRTEECNFMPGYSNDF